ncbi:hypothetical protein MMC22_001182 [Lobaria immixta]|nr:hypothetical protein [Lobaria immixta]
MINITIFSAMGSWLGSIVAAIVIWIVSKLEPFLPSALRPSPNPVIAPMNNLVNVIEDLTHEVEKLSKEVETLSQLAQTTRETHEQPRLDLNSLVASFNDAGGSPVYQLEVGVTVRLRRRANIATGSSQGGAT